MHFNIKDLTGKKFGRLSVDGYSHSAKYGTKHSKAYWNCTCECGNEVKVQTSHLTSGHTRSCGCYQIENARQINYKHGMKHDRIYEIWCNMIRRCTDVDNPAYKNYGGRGISVCNEWLDFGSFYNDMRDGYSPSLTIDRINNSEG
jgi:hypothetical protein